jgi:hypothetical protein
MIRLLSEIGRALLIVSAVATVLAGVVLGYFLARSTEATASGAFQISDIARFTPDEIFGCIFGGAAGLLVAGSIFGIIATFYDLNDNIKRLIDLAGGQLGGLPHVERNGRNPNVGDGSRGRMEPSIERPGP